MYQQATIAVEHEATYGIVHKAIDQAFASVSVDAFLRSLEKSRLRIRHFEEILHAGKLGPEAAEAYRKLGNGDGGMIREHYLSSLERVDPELRRKYLKVYAYY